MAGAPAGGPAGAVDYYFDAVGDRLGRASTLPGVATQNPTFDANDRQQGRAQVLEELADIGGSWAA